MANTVSVLSYANTFGDWMINTNDIANELNRLSKGTYTMEGTLVLNGSGVGLQVSNTALFTGNVLMTGPGTSLQVTNSANVGSNLTIGHTLTANNLLVTGSIGGTAVIQFRQRLLDDALAVSVALS
jgi:hypothetical protein